METSFRVRDLSGPSYYRDPAPVLRAMREAGPLVNVRFPILGDLWMTTTHQAAGEVLKQSKTFRIRRDDGRVTGMKWWMPRTVRVLTNNMLSHDDPDHRRLRGLVGEAFQRRSIATMEAEIAGIADALAGDMARQGGGDALTDIARRLPVLVILQLLGLRRSDRAWLETTLRRAMMVQSAAGFVLMLPALRKLLRFFEAEIARQREAPEGGLISDLIALQGETPDAINGEELLSMIFLLFAAGIETTTHLISGGLRLICLDGTVSERLAAGEDCASLLVEECLRFVSPVQVTKPRFVSADMRIGGMALSHGDTVMAGITAANHDPQVFDGPQHFMPERKPNPHLAFGTGPHFCLGFQLARLEAKVLFERLFSQYAVELAVPDEDLTFRRRPGLNALAGLPIKIAQR